MLPSEAKICQNCKTDFTIDPEDFDFYRKIDVPPPTWCPECRVRQFKTITLGLPAAEKGGDPTRWAPPDDRVQESDFYVYALGDEHMCLGSSCGLGGYYVECLGGWLSGYKAITEEFDYGLRAAGVSMKDLTVITVADKNAKIVGIYPGARIRNLPYLMRNHRDLVPADVFKECSDQIPRRLKDLQ
ncbi:MAG: hypothetical protein HY978_01565 [Candidatus Liptonbacteria bacterium]|nr:hypothetical protein [Candidatus Liptonbacteria bacterium]